MPPHPSTNSEIQKYFQKKPKFNGVYSRNNLLKIKDAAYVKNLDEDKSIGNRWIALYVNDNYVTYFDSFEIQHIQKGIKKFIGNKIIITNIYRIQAYDNVRILLYGFIYFISKGKSLLDYTKFFSLNIYEKNDEIILKYFQ